MRKFVDIVTEDAPPVAGDVGGIMKVRPVNYDQRNGIGAVPHNNDIKYIGFAMFMTPQMFLSLATERTYPDNFIIYEMDAGHPIGSPFLDILFDEDNRMVARVYAHEGRGRAAAVQKLYGDIPMLVHGFPHGHYGEMRARHITLEMLNGFRREAVPEKSKIIREGPNCARQVWLLDGWKTLE